LNIDKAAKSTRFRHSRESGNPGKPTTCGPPLSRERQPWRLFTRLSILKIEYW